MEKISLCHRISDFDGKMPFDFQNCCNIKDDKDVATLLSLLLTYTLTALIFIIFLRKRIWDYAITIGFVHLILSCAVMQAFPTNWEWWIAFLSSVLFMALFGEVAVRCFLKKKTQSASISPQENVIT